MIGNKNFGNFEKIIKHGIYFAIVIFIINIVYISSIIYYLNNLKTCSCYEAINKLNYSNITYLIVIESIILIMNIIGLIGMIGLLTNISTLKKIGKNIKVNKLANKVNEINPNIHIYSIIVFIYLIVYGYFIYYTYKLHENVDDNCKCTQSWLRYLLYIQATLMAISIINAIYVIYNQMVHKKIE